MSDTNKFKIEFIIENQTNNLIDAADAGEIVLDHLRDMVADNNIIQIRQFSCQQVNDIFVVNNHGRYVFNDVKEIGIVNDKES